MDQQDVTLDQRLSSGSDTIEDVDDEFLQDLFKSPLTKVSTSLQQPNQLPYLSAAVTGGQATVVNVQD